MKTGECYFLNEFDNSLWIATSYQNEFGLVWTINSKVDNENF